MKRIISLGVFAMMLVPLALFVPPVAARGDGENICEQARSSGHYGNHEVHLGTPGEDVLRGGAGNDLICGFGGNDVLRGGSGNDIIVGGEGSDDLTGASGNDILYIDPLDSRTNGGSGQNQVIMDGPFITFDVTMGVTTIDGQETCEFRAVIDISYAQPGTEFNAYYGFSNGTEESEIPVHFLVHQDGRAFSSHYFGNFPVGIYTTRLELVDADGHVIISKPPLSCVA